MKEMVVRTLAGANTAPLYSKPNNRSKMLVRIDDGEKVMLLESVSRTEYPLPTYAHIKYKNVAVGYIWRRLLKEVEE